MATTTTGAGLTKGARITGADREALGARLAERYQAGESIRALAQDTGRSFGFVHGVIKESGVPLRGRGGATRGNKPAAVPAARPAATPSSAASSSGAKEGNTKKSDAKKVSGKKTGAKKDEGKKDEGKKEKSAGKKKVRS